ncbi:MAG: hypothetical protein V4724_19315 [Pseudomonadota bacterium]
MKRLLLTALISLACAAAPATAAGTGDSSSHGSNPSQDLATASGVVVFGSLIAVALTGSVIVKSVEAVGDGSLVVLEGASDAGKATIKLSGEAAQGLSLAAGTVVSVTAVSTGHVLVLSGKAIAFIPNEIGQALLHHSRVSN